MAVENRFGIGDLVTLKGNNWPVMTVDEQFGDNVTLLWFDVDGKMQRDTLFADVLVKSKQLLPAYDD